MESKADDEVDDETDNHMGCKTDKQTDTTDMPHKESAAQRRKQEAKELKILTPNQMLSRLPTSLAQLEAGNNSKKLKNEIRQLLFSIKKLSKTIYKHLMNII